MERSSVDTNASSPVAQSPLRWSAGEVRRASDAAWPWAALAAIMVAELLTTFGNPLWGVAIHVALLTIFVTAGALVRDRGRAAFYLSLMLAPLIRVVSLGMPLGEFQQTYWYLLSALPLFSAGAVIVRLNGYSWQSVGLRLPARSALPLEAAVAASGFALGAVEYVILRPDPLADGAGAGLIALSVVILLIGTGVMEEFVFRGVLQRAAQGVFPGVTGLVYVSLLFAVLHIGHKSVLDVVFVVGVALWFGAVVRRTGTILGVSLAHGITNAVLLVLIPRLLG
jgi:uncharacterized protein